MVVAIVHAENIQKIKTLNIKVINLNRTLNGNSKRTLKMFGLKT